MQFRDNTGMFLFTDFFLKLRKYDVIRWHSSLKAEFTAIHGAYCEISDNVSSANRS